MEILNFVSRRSAEKQLEMIEDFDVMALDFLTEEKQELLEELLTSAYHLTLENIKRFDLKQLKLWKTEQII